MVKARFKARQPSPYFENYFLYYFLIITSDNTQCDR